MPQDLRARPWMNGTSTLRLLALCTGPLWLGGCDGGALAPSGNDDDTVQAALLNAKSGDTVVLGAGTFRFTKILSLSVDNVTLKGQGSDKTILSFKGQTVGASGIKVTSNNFTAQDFAIEDPPGDGLKVEGAKGVKIQRLRVEWTGGPDTKNGPYGIYPVLCDGVLVEDSYARAASDTGIYVGQSQNIIVRRNKLVENVAGIEIENSNHADVYDNTATQNSGGILIFGLPGLKRLGGGQVRVFNNKIIDNNTDNFANKGNIIAQVPRGTGTFVMANDQVEVFGNTIQDNQTVSMAVISYLLTDLKITDANYDPYPYAVYLHDNTVIGGGSSPDASNSLGLALRAFVSPMPDIVHDGFVNPAKLVNGKLPDNLRICARNNTRDGKAATIANVDGPGLIKIQHGADPKTNPPMVVRDPAPYDCAQPALPAVVLPGSQQ